ncbi:hypothetical protein [Flagellimonas oceani]|uniref:Uncharacterized protein n=1 Tax=Flagellimonas oceani TaxID=2698672 RepID=A0A6G7IZJ3_9FLAO|nr:hypothetical protein [Allomuricauda oceani]QII43820.1 hypothetical protein GVT53_03730 [Allomuricauda oceani]
MEKVVHHLSEIFDWDSKQPKEPRTLILGSFNPYNPTDENPTDFYYSRLPKRGSGNRFWTTIGKLKYNNPKYFRENLERRFEELVESEFMFLDLIKSIVFKSEDEMILDQFLNKKVYGNFGDNDIWTTKTKYESIPINIKRNYNEKVLETLSNSKSIKKVINTLGGENGNLEFNKREKEWSEFKNQLFQICESREIELVLESVSPSPQGGSSEKLEKWVNNHILKKYVETFG